MTEQTPEQVLEGIRALKAVPDVVEGDVQEDALVVDGFADLDSFFDDSLELPIRGRVYRVPPASAELGLLCSRLMMAGEQVAKKGRVTSLTQAQLEDDDETELYQRLLGHVPFLPGTGSVAVLGDDGQEVEPTVDPTPNPAYRPDDDVWQQLLDAGLDWQRLQHVGTTALIWTAVGKPAAQAFWITGARPKVSAAPQPRAPQDHQPKAGGGTAKSGRRGSTAGTTTRTKAKKGATAGT